MKKIINLYFMIFILNSCFSQCIILEPIGVMDKPLPIFKISTNPNDSGKNEYYLSTRAFYILNANIKKHLNNCDSLVTDSVRRFWYSAYGSYKIIISTTIGNKEYFLDSSKKSHLFFVEQLPIFKENNELYLRIESLLRRL